MCLNPHIKARSKSNILLWNLDSEFCTLHNIQQTVPKHYIQILALLLGRVLVSLLDIYPA